MKEKKMENIVESKWEYVYDDCNILLAKSNVYHWEWTTGYKYIVEYKSRMRGWIDAKNKKTNSNLAHWI